MSIEFEHYLDEANQLQQLREKLSLCGHRILLPCFVTKHQLLSLISSLQNSLQTEQRLICLGALEDEFGNHANFKTPNGHQFISQHLLPGQGKQVLGHEIDIIICSASNLHPDSFNAACGALRAGGVVFILMDAPLPLSNSQNWLYSHLEQWPILTSKILNKPEDFSTFIHCYHQKFVGTSPWTQFCSEISGSFVTSGQKLIFESMNQLVSGHRKRPLVLTANRGRGKSSIIGIGLAQILFEKKIKVIVSAPRFSAVLEIYTHFCRHFNLLDKHSNLQANQQHLRCHSGASIEFYSPDRLIKESPECDLLVIDEAAAIPLPILKQVVEVYHRLMLSTTMHGYEGCGRGFALKFIPWLKENRPGTNQVHLEHAIRWSDSDPLETWLFDTFLYKAKVESSFQRIESSKLEFLSIEKNTLHRNPNLVSQLFGLLISAHYQTTANDLWQLFDAPELVIYQVKYVDTIVGCILARKEGGLSAQIAESICLGKRRPAGHLVAALLANQYASPKIAQQSSLRVMRIAVLPQYQGQGIGSFALKELMKHSKDYDFLSTSFGATNELIDFWSKKFHFAFLGSKQDKASGTYSACLIHPISEGAFLWLRECQSLWLSQFPLVASALWADIDLDTLLAILLRSTVLNDLSIQASSEEYSTYHLSTSVQPLSKLQMNRLRNYALGGNCFESVIADLKLWYLSQVIAGELQISLSAHHLWLNQVILSKSWSETSSKLGYTGRKQIESQIRETLNAEFTV